MALTWLWRGSRERSGRRMSRWVIWLGGLRLPTRSSRWRPRISTWLRLLMRGLTQFGCVHPAAVSKLSAARRQHVRFEPIRCR